MRFLGLSAYYHDSAAALVQDGEVIAAAQEERFTRKKHDSRFPHHAIRSCLEATGTRPGDIDIVAFYDKPFLKFERLLETYLAFAPRGFASFRQALPLWIKEKLFQRHLLANELAELDDEVDWERRLLFSEHHLSHAASAFFPSPFERAAVLTMDGVGEWSTTSLALGKGRDLNVIRERLIDVKEDGSFRLNLEYFEYCTGLTMTNGRFDELFGGPPRKPDAPLTQREMDLAASIQAVIEELVLKLARGVARETGEKNLCLAGGVALNCVANGKLLRDGCFERIWLQPAAGDAGGALGAALVGYHLSKGQGRHINGALDGMHGGYLGPEYGQADIESRLSQAGAVFETV